MQETISPMLKSILRAGFWASFVGYIAATPSGAITAHPVIALQPWMNTGLTADERASLIVSQMTQAEKLSLVRGWMGLPYRPDAQPGQFNGNKDFHDVIGSVGYIPGIARLGMPSLQETDAGLGVANLMGAIRPGDVATALPSSMSLAASFNPVVAYQGGAMIGHEAWSKGLNVLLAGGVNLVRDPRNGRNFEYLGEDPLLAGTLAGQSIRGIQDQHVISTVKHYAFNDQETNRGWENSVIDEAAARESDLLAFELAIEGGRPGSVMCAYNLINGRYACENDQFLNGVLKGDWRYAGWVMSDWGAVHSVDSATAGLDQESAAMLDKEDYFGKPLEDAVQSGKIPTSRLADMAHRILRSMFVVGVFDHPATKSAIDYKADGEVALHAAEEGAVLLKNSGDLLPLTQNVTRIAVIGGHADAGVLSGGGSSQVMPVGASGVAVPIEGADMLTAGMNTMIFDPSAPLQAIRAKAVHAEVRFDSGRYPSSAARLAKWADVVIVFATQWTIEGVDVPDLTLPEGQDQLITAVAAANAKTIVVLETGGPVVMPWLDKVGAVVEAWYPGQRGGDAIANVLVGAVNPSGHLPITFPADVRQLPRPEIPGTDIMEPSGFGNTAQKSGTIFDVNYTEGSDVGYRWFAKKKLKPLFPFGYGLSYTSFDYSNLSIGGPKMIVSFDVANTGKVEGSVVPQIYLTSRAGKPLRRLIGFSKLALTPGQKQHVSLSVDPRLLADFDVAAHLWRIPGGVYTVGVALSATEVVLTASTKLDHQIVKP